VPAVSHRFRIHHKLLIVSALILLPLVAITRIVDAEGNVLEDYKVPQGEQVIDPRAAYMITSTLADPTAKLFTYGPSTPLVLRQGTAPNAPIWPSASKTGTTDNNRDTWTAGYTPDLAIVVWVGNTNGAPMKEVLSSMTAGKIWPEAMAASFDYLKLQSQDFARPENLVERQVCGDTRMRPGQPLCRMDLFFTERAPQVPMVVPAPARPAASPAPSPVERAPATREQTAPERAPQPAPRQPAPAPTARPAPLSRIAPQPTPLAKPQPTAAARQPRQGRKPQPGR
jgi:membrane peptidoglycan carboxypeptidase